MIDELRAQRSRLHTEAEQLLTAVESDAQRSLAAGTADANRWSALTDEMGQLDKRIAEVDELDRRAALAGRAGEQFRGARHFGEGGDVDEIRDVLRGEKRSFELDMGGTTTRVGRGGAWEIRDLGTTSGAIGGDIVPATFRGELMEHLVAMSGVRQTNVTVLQTSSGEPLTIPKTTSHSAAAQVDEGAQIPESDPAFDQAVLGSFKYGLLIDVPTELIDDAGIDLQGYLARESGQAVGNATGAHYVAGNGTTQPKGVVSAATVGKTGAPAVGGLLSSDDLIDLHFSVLPAYRANGFWMMNDLTASMIRKLKDNDDNYLWERSLTAGTPDRLLGRPVVIDPNVPNPAVGARSVLFGDFSRYYIRDVKGIRFESTDQFRFDRDMTTFRCLFRTDGDLIDTTGAIKAFVGGAVS